MTTRTTIVEPRRETPVRGEFDVVVAGGGPAGIAAAVSAAQEGARTLLVERYGYLGGLMTGAYVTCVLGMGDGQRQVIRGFAQEVHDRLAALDIDACKNLNSSGDYNTDAEVFKWLAAKMINEAGGSILLHALCCDPVKADGVVQGVIVESKSGREAILAKVVVDATADGDIAHLAGASHELSLYDITPVIWVRGIDKAKVETFKNENPAKYAELAAKSRKLGGGVLPGTHRYLKGFDATNVDHLTAIETSARRDIMESLILLKKELPGYENAKVTMSAPQLGVRESRRIKGGHILSEKDMLASRKFPDSICRSGAHMVGYNTYGTKGLGYDIPYRCLVPDGVAGLLCAGRCISTTHEALNTMRLIAQCMATGQAAGVAAALSVGSSTRPRHVSIPSLQNALRRQGVYLGD